MPVLPVATAWLGQVQLWLCHEPAGHGSQCCMCHSQPADNYFGRPFTTNILCFPDNEAVPQLLLVLAYGKYTKLILSRSGSQAVPIFTVGADIW